MVDFLDLFAKELRKARKENNITQRQLAEKLNMSIRTIMEIENCKSNPKFETVITIARELNISLDSIVFGDLNTNDISKPVIDFFSSKCEEEAQMYIEVCKTIDSRLSSK